MCHGQGRLVREEVRRERHLLGLRGRAARVSKALAALARAAHHVDSLERQQLREIFQKPLLVPAVVKHDASLHVSAENDGQAECGAVLLPADARAVERHLVARRRLHAQEQTRSVPPTVAGTAVAGGAARASTKGRPCTRQSEAATSAERVVENQSQRRLAIRGTHRAQTARGVSNGSASWRSSRSCSARSCTRGHACGELILFLLLQFACQPLIRRDRSSAHLPQRLKGTES